MHIDCSEGNKVIVIILRLCGLYLETLLRSYRKLEVIKEYGNSEYDRSTKESIYFYMKFNVLLYISKQKSEV